MSSSSSSHGERKAKLSTRIVSGTAGSLVTSLLVTPLEVAKVRLQASTSSGRTNWKRTASSISNHGNNSNNNSGSSGGIPHINNKSNSNKSAARVIPCPKGCGKLLNTTSGGGTTTSTTTTVAAGARRMVVGTAKKEISTATAAVVADRAAATVTEQGIFDTLRRIFMQEGFSGIYAGLRPTLVMAVPNTVLYYSSYEEIVWRLRRWSSSSSSSLSAYDLAQEQTQSWIPITAGASARLVASTCTAPFEYLRTKQASMVGQGIQSASMVQEFQTIVEKEGPSALFRGLRPTLWRDVPFSAIYWLCLERFRDLWISFESSSSSNVLIARTPAVQAGEAFVNGAIAGMIAATVTTPFDVIKTRQQAVVETVASCDFHKAAGHWCDHGGAAAVAVAGPCGEATTTTTTMSSSSGTLAYMRHIVEVEGVGGLWRGNTARVLKVAPACAIMISSYEFGKRVLEGDVQ